MLRRVGDADLGEWIERREESGLRVVHLRRRVSAKEEKITGPAVDVRGTPEMYRRLNVVAMHSGVSAAQLVAMESGLLPIA